MNIDAHQSLMRPPFQLPGCLERTVFLTVLLHGTFHFIWEY